MYRIFDGAVDSDVALPGLPEIAGIEADIRVLSAGGAVKEDGCHWFHTWRDGDGDVLLSCARLARGNRSGRYLLRFPGLADFLIEDNTVSCYPGPDCSEDSLSHLVLDQVLPRVWAHRGNLVLHASAVELPDGRVIAFVGQSGLGKSTLAAALWERGGQLLGDDCFNVRVSAGRAQLIPCYRGLRLHQDTIGNLGLYSAEWTDMAHYSLKQRLVNAGVEYPGTFWLSSLYLLEQPAGEKVPAVESLQGMELTSRLITQSFLLDIEDRRCARQQLQEAANLQRISVGTFSLVYPRDYACLPDLCDFISRPAARHSGPGRHKP